MPTYRCFVQNGITYTNKAAYDAIIAAIPDSFNDSIIGPTHSLFGAMQICVATESELDAMEAKMDALEAKYGKRAVYGPECTLP